MLSWTNDYVYELRDFLRDNDNNEAEIERIKKIPLGKWNYLPERSKKTQDFDSLGLVRAIGKTSLTGEPINEVYFSGIKTKEEQATYIENETALSLVKTTSDDNKKLKDEISLNRVIAARLSKRIAKTRAEATEVNYEFKPKQKEALTIHKNFILKYS